MYGGVLLHEVGHHIHATVAPKHSAKEDFVEHWEKIASRDGAQLEKKASILRALA